MASDKNYNLPLWVTDGTESGTSLVTTFPYPAYAVDSRGISYTPVYAFLPQTGDSPAVFIAWKQDTGNQFWKSDGSAAGTQILTTNASRNSLRSTLIIGSSLYYVADVTVGTELWKVDIETGVSSRVTDFNPSGDDAVTILPDDNLGSDHFVSANNGAQTVLYRVTENGVSEFSPSNARSAVSSGGLVFFTTADAAPGPRFWNISLRKSDPTTAGKTLLLSGLTSLTMTPLGNGRLFVAANDGVHGREPWISDGTPEGTRLIADLNPGRGDSNPTIRRGLNADWYLFTDDHVLPEFYRYQPQTGALSLVKAGVRAGYPAVAIGNYWYFATADQENGTGIWRTDGTSAGTSYAGIAPPVHPDGVRLLGSVGSQLLLSCGDGTHGIEPWISDGTAAGTRLLRDCQPGGRDKDMVPVAATSTAVYFTSTRLDGADNSIRDLWSTDGVSPTAHLAVPLDNTPIDSAVANADRLFYIRRDATPHLFGSNGSATGTFQLADVPAGPGGVIPFRNGAAFIGADAQRPRALYFTDGTSSGTAALTPGGTVVQGSLTASSTHVYFFASGTSTELWRSDGSAAGTARVLTLPASDMPSSTQIATVGDTFFFYMVSTNQLWKSDGTASGTTVVSTISAVSNLWSVNGSLFVLAGSQLWKSDGTGATPVLIKSRIAAPAPIAGASAVMGNVLFWYSSIVGFSQLWRSDGTTDGTYPLVHFASSGSLIPPRLATVHGHVFFCGEDPTHGRQLWLTNGTRGSTHEAVLYGDTTWSSASDDFMVLHDLLFFGSAATLSEKYLAVCDASSGESGFSPSPITITDATVAADGLTVSGSSVTRFLNYTYSGASNGHGTMTTGTDRSVSAGIPSPYYLPAIPLNPGTTDVYITIIDQYGMSNEATLTFNGGVWLPTPVPPPAHRRATN